MSAETKSGRIRIDTGQLEIQSEFEEAFQRRKPAPLSRRSTPDTNDSLSLYLSDIDQEPLLSAEQEVQLAKRIERGEFAREKMVQGNSTKENTDELQNLINDGQEAFKHLILANRRLVVSVAKKHVGHGVPFGDLIQEGNIGLVRAAKKFEYQRGNRFSTYATWWIRQAVSRGNSDQGRTIRLPVHMGDQINRLIRASYQLTQTLGRDPTEEELAVYTGSTRKRVEDIQKFAQTPLSLEQPSDYKEKGAVLGDFVEDSDSISPVELTNRTLLREQLRDIFETMPPREVKVLEFRFALNGGKKHTLKEVGRKIGVTRERVRQLEEQALGRLRNPIFKSVLIDYLK